MLIACGGCAWPCGRELDAAACRGTRAPQGRAARPGAAVCTRALAAARAARGPAETCVRACACACACVCGARIYGTVHIEVEVVELLPVRVGLRGVDRHACAVVGPRVGVRLGWLVEERHTLTLTLTLSPDPDPSPSVGPGVSLLQAVDDDLAIFGREPLEEGWHTHRPRGASPLRGRPGEDPRAGQGR